MSSLENIAVLGGGSWATALSRLLLQNCKTITWYMRRDDRIEEFIRIGHNPAYLTDVMFDTNRINFSSDINYVCDKADVLLLAMPSPYFKSHTEKISVDLSGKTIVSAVKGIVPDENQIITDYMVDHFGVNLQREIVISGPCHAEEVALERLSYLTIGCSDLDKSRRFSELIAGKKMKTIVSRDVSGVEYAAVLKNVYAIAAGIISGMKAGDNFMAMMVSNAIREMARFVDAIAPMEGRDICRSAYLGDLLVTAYSRFSRNHNFGAMIGKGYRVKAAMMEMEQVAEGYYATDCIHRINAEGTKVSMPILDCVYSILYENRSPRRAIDAIVDTFS